MHLSAPLEAVADTTVQPIVGNGNCGGACYDGSGQALYAVYINNEFQVWRTRGGFSRLRDENNSVDYLSTVLPQTAAQPTSMALQRINGTVYATISAVLKSGAAGTWIYRDTGGGGLGPWVLHGTINALTGTDGTTNAGTTVFASEIVVLADGTWMANAPKWVGFNGTGTGCRGAVWTSGDAGITWTNRLDVWWRTVVDGLYGEAWSRNFGQFNGAWYVGGAGNVEGGKHFKSTDGITWTDIGDLGAGAEYGYDFPVSDPQWIFRWAPIADQLSPRMLQSAPGAPESLPLWANFLNATLPYSSGTGAGTQYPLMCNIGPSAAPMLIATNWGQVLSVGGGSTVMPPCRQYPREDGLATSSARRIFPQARSEQGGIRRAGGTYY